MELTEKCKEDFLKWLGHNHGLGINDYELGKAVFLNALIIDFFDSVEIYIQNWAFVDFVEKEKSGFDCTVYYNYANNDFDQFFPTRKDAINAAILYANQIYNEKG